MDAQKAKATGVQTAGSAARRDPEYARAEGKSSKKWGRQDTFAEQPEKSWSEPRAKIHYSW
jgi:hypothetical protein